MQPQHQWLTGTVDDTKARARLREFDLGPHLHHIKSPVFICHGAEDTIVSPQAAEKTFNSLVSLDNKSKTLRYFTKEENAGWHCQVNNPTESYPVMFDWVIDQLTR